MPMPMDRWVFPLCKALHSGKDHLTVNHGIEGLNEFDPLRKGLDDRQMANFREYQIRWNDRLHDAPPSLEFDCGASILTDTALFTLMVVVEFVCIVLSLLLHSPIVWYTIDSTAKGGFFDKH